MSVTDVKYERSRGWIAVGEEREDWRGMKEWKIKEADGGKQKTEREKWGTTQMETSRKENREGSPSSKTRRVLLLYKGHRATGRLELETCRFYRPLSAWGTERGSVAAERGRAEEDEEIMGRRRTCRQAAKQINTNLCRLCWCYCFNVFLTQNKMMHLYPTKSTAKVFLYTIPEYLLPYWPDIPDILYSFRTYGRDVLPNRPIRLLQSCSACLCSDSAYSSEVIS